MPFSETDLSEPNFFIVGAAKCGTTALFDYLSQHPGAWCPLDKEPNYFAFDYPALQGPKTEADYLALFAGAGDAHLARGEASVLYFFSRVAVREIRRRYPAARLIVNIRNPAEMVYSFHSQLLNTVNEDQRDFEKAWRLQDERLAGRRIPGKCLVPEFLQYREIGRLSVNIKRILEVFPARQLKIVNFDDMKADPQQVFDEVTDYLELPRHAGVDFRVVNANRVQKSRLIAGVTERPLQPGVHRFISRSKKALGLQRIGFRRWLSGLNTRQAPRRPLSAGFAAELREYFADEVRELEQLTGRDLSAWRS